MKADMTPFLSRPIAHRGLHDGEKPENSIPAFRAAIVEGFPIETDVHFSKDGILVVFHDDTLLRMTGDGRKVEECTLKELKELRLKDTEERIPTFAEFLAEVDGKVPVLIEIKNMAKVSPKRIATALAEALEGYKGAYAVQSFQPFYVKAYKKLKPEIPCGVLSTAHFRKEDFGGGAFWKLKAWLMSGMRLNFTVKPDFASYCFTDLNTRAVKKFKGPVLAWTVRSAEEEALAKERANNVIFEGYLPHGA